jgi:hypothetical protein
LLTINQHQRLQLNLKIKTPLRKPQITKNPSFMLPKFIRICELERVKTDLCRIQMRKSSNFRWVTSGSREGCRVVVEGVGSLYRNSVWCEWRSPTRVVAFDLFSFV